MVPSAQWWCYEEEEKEEEEEEEEEAGLFKADAVNEEDLLGSATALPRWRRTRRRKVY